MASKNANNYPGPRREHYIAGRKNGRVNRRLAFYAKESCCQTNYHPGRICSFFSCCTARASVHHFRIPRECSSALRTRVYSLLNSSNYRVPRNVSSILCGKISRALLHSCVDPSSFIIMISSESDVGKGCLIFHRCCSSFLY